MADTNPPNQPTHRHLPGDPWSPADDIADPGGAPSWNGRLTGGFDPGGFDPGGFPLMPAVGWPSLANWAFAPSRDGAAGGTTSGADALVMPMATACGVTSVADVSGPMTPAVPAATPTDLASLPGLVVLSNVSLNSGVVLSDGGSGAITNTVTATSSAAASMNVPVSHVFNGQTLTGTGIKIGILSDSFDNAGTAALNADIAAGNLPASGVTDVEDLLNGAGSDEGRAMAQLIYQVAPGAQLYFYSGLNSETDFAAGIGSLVALGCNVIVDDITYLDEPFYQDGSAIDVAVENAVSAGVSYFTSAGNAGKDFYEHAWSSSSVAVSGVTGTAYNFGTSGSPNDFESITGVAVGGRISLDLQWDQPFATIGNSAGTDDELTMYLFNSGGTLLATSFTPAGDAGDPDEQLAFTNTGTATASYQLAVVDTSGAVPGLFKVIDYGVGTISGGTGGAGVGSGTVIGHALVPTANTVGASNYSGAANFHNGTDELGVESFSAYGPGEFLFNSTGTRLAQATTLAKVNFTAADGSTTSVVLNGSNNTFSGTSASAPDAAAVAALMLQADPNLTPAQITQDIEQTATTVSGAGVTVNDKGAGFVNALGAITDAQNAAAACYARGTRIATDRGPIPIEALTPGDRVITLDGPQPVRWTGSRHIDLTRHPRPELARPIRIHRDAIADAVPHHDVLVSPDHALFLDGMLIIARLLTNGASIAPDHAATSVEYHHVEFDRHAVLFADGLPAESYLDTGNRALFSDNIVQNLHPDLSTRAAPKTWQHDACAPLTDNPARVRPIWQRLADRARDLGFRLPHVASTTEPALHIVADGRTILPIAATAGRYTFVLPQRCRTARLRSRANAPTDAQPWIEDRRRLGVCVSRIRLTGNGETHDIPVDHPALCDGWWDVERAEGQQWRWTNGEALLPLSTAAAILELHVVGEMTYRLDAPAPHRMAA